MATSDDKKTRIRVETIPASMDARVSMTTSEFTLVEQLPSPLVADQLLLLIDCFEVHVAADDVSRQWGGQDAEDHGWDDFGREQA